jgi:hypothetical protein
LLGVAYLTAKKVARNWTNRDHQKHWESLTGLGQAKGSLQGPSVRKTKELLKLNRNQLRWATGLLIEHCHLKGHLFKMGFNDRTPHRTLSPERTPLQNGI